MEYIECVVAAVPNDNRQQFVDHANRVAVIFKDHGALRVVECWGDDVPEGKVTSLPMAVKCEPGESVVFSLAVWPSREARDTGMEGFMSDPRMEKEMASMPFDGSRLIHGGFQVIIDV